MAYRRDEFPVAEQYAYFQHAAVSALPRPVREAIESITRDMTDNGCLNEKEWRRSIKETRGLASELLDAPTDRLGFVSSTSHGLSWVAESLPLEDGDTVLVPEVEFPANQFPWQNLTRKGVEFRTLPSPNGTVRARNLREALDPSVEVFACSSVQFSNGFRADLEELGSLCQDHDVHFVVDSIQSLGWDDLDLYSLPVDAVCADAHKWLCGPESVGVLYLDRTFQKQLEPAMVGWQSVESPWQFDDPSFELKDEAAVVEMGSYNTIGLLAFAESLRMLLDVGLPTIRDHNLSLKDELTDRLAELDVACTHTDWEEKHHSPIVSLTHPNLDVDGLTRRARDRNIQLSVRGGRVRVALHLYNNQSDLEELVGFLDEEVSG